MFDCGDKDIRKRINMQQQPRKAQRKSQTEKFILDETL